MPEKQSLETIKCKGNILGGNRSMSWCQPDLDSKHQESLNIHCRRLDLEANCHWSSFDGAMNSIVIITQLPI